MAIDYLRNRPWTDWTREERFFCAALYQHAAQDPAALAAWVIETAGLRISTAGTWDLGFEVCLYRDFLWQQGKSARGLRFPAKRTFDLCLFGEGDMIVIEAKVCDKFSKKQAFDFKKEKERIGRIDEVKHLGIHLVALASQSYFDNAKQFGDPETLRVFSGRVTWADIFRLYQDPLFEQAEHLYHKKPWACVVRSTRQAGLPREA